MTIIIYSAFGGLVYYKKVPHPFDIKFVPFQSSELITVYGGLVHTMFYQIYNLDAFTGGVIIE
jgi:hypothetical protein